MDSHTIKATIVTSTLDRAKELAVSFQLSHPEAELIRLHVEQVEGDYIATIILREEVE